MCGYGYLEYAKWLYSLGKVDIHANNDCTFRYSCQYGHLEVAKWLYSFGDVNINYYYEGAFRTSCKNGHPKVAKWLYSLGNIDISAFNDSSFRWACKNNDIPMVKWFITLRKNYKVFIRGNRVIKWKILNPLDYLENDEIDNHFSVKKEEHKLDDLGCPVCYDQKPKLTVKTVCGHIFCFNCIY